MCVFYESIVTLLGTPDNFAGSVILYSLATVLLMTTASGGFIIIAAIVRRLLR